jgi:hypothetical protein
MTSLIVLGNINRFTFANSILAANSKSLEVFKTALSSIFVIHSSESQNTLKQYDDWLEHLIANNISDELFSNRKLEISGTEDSVKKFAAYIEYIVNGLSVSSNLMIDLTNGTSLQKNLLSTVSYVLDVNHQYMIDIIQLSKTVQVKGFLSADVLLPSYVLSPNSTSLDKLAYLNLSEIIRYKRIIDNHTTRYSAIDQESSDEDFFKNNLSHSIQLKLRGDLTKDNSVYRIAASSISASVEDLLGILINKFLYVNKPGGANRLTFGEKLRELQSKLEEEVPPDFDIEFFKKFNDFILYLRNSTTHKSKILTDMEKFKADLSVKMAFPYIEFYTDLVYPILSSNSFSENPKQIKNLSYSDISPSDTIYYGIDGDNTGSILEQLFLSSSDETKFKKLSESITKAIDKIYNFIRSDSKKSSIVFKAGDDILFKGCLNEEKLKAIQEIYYETTSGLTCSIGYGKSFQEVYLALKLAKTKPGKNSIVGVELC